MEDGGGGMWVGGGWAGVEGVEGAVIHFASSVQVCGCEFHVLFCCLVVRKKK